MSFGAPHEIVKFMNAAAREDELEVVAVEVDGHWIDLEEKLFPDATLMVVWATKGVKGIAVKLDQRVSEFDLKKLIVRDGGPYGVDRVMESSES